mmetsp:Transcript_109406/g.223549  ORF Transcript_109406/g.223549 Transcript_109406/m.223549 type:complete len:214 (-) Transcript_109406:1429-2070(-)
MVIRIWRCEKACGTHFFTKQHRREEKDDDDDDDDEGTFVCRNNLEREEPINQCQRFVEEGKNTMTAATYRDILLAESQGTVTGIDVSPLSENKRGKLTLGEPFVKPKHNWLSVLLLLLSIFYFGHALSQLFEKDRSKHGSMDEPLVGDKRKNKKSQNNQLEKQKKQEQQQQQRKKSAKTEKKSSARPILKNSKRYEDDNDSSSDDSTHYSRYR